MSSLSPTTAENADSEEEIIIEYICSENENETEGERFRIVANTSGGNSEADDVHQNRDDDNDASEPMEDTIEIIEHVCSKCEKSYKSLGSLKQHLMRCGQKSPKRKRAQRNASPAGPIRKSSRRMSTIEKQDLKTESDKDEDQSKSAPKSPTGDHELAYEIEEVTNDLETSLCYCCDEPTSNAHMGHINCKLCAKKFRTFAGREIHMVNIHNSSEDHKCTLCTAQCPTAEILEKHLTAHNDGKPFSCEKCGKDFTRKYHLERHIMHTSCGNDSNKIEGQSCDVCGKFFTRIDNLREHLRVHMGQSSRKREFNCTICEKSFFGKSLLEIHVRTHTGERPFPCDMCEKRFPSNGALRKHRRVHTGEKPFVCSYCQARFAAKETLNRHTRIHTGQKKHTCEICNVSFIQATQLRNHMFHHTGDNGFECPECDEKFDRKMKMIKHMDKMHNLAHKCAICDVMYASVEDLEKHMPIHSDRNFMCDDCYTYFPSKADLMKHVEQCKYESDPKFDCKVCGRDFKRLDLLLKHVKALHASPDKEAVVKSPKKRGRPKKVIPVDTEVSSAEEAVNVKEVESPAAVRTHNRDDLFNKLKGNFENDRFVMAPELKELGVVRFKTRAELMRVLTKIMENLLDMEVLEGLGWPKATMDEILQKVTGILQVKSHENERDLNERLRKNMMSLLGKFIGATALETMLNNYTTDQVLQYMLNVLSGS